MTELADYTVPTVYYSDLDAGERTKKGKSIKSYVLAVDDFKLIFSTDNATEKVTHASNAIRHIICSLKHDKYNQSSKLLLKSVYAVCKAVGFFGDIDDSLKCDSVKAIINSSDDYTY
tara:strand:+ start:697 stop:1047 length:351 start_codon:yes stop_codon:yes gene_type:complete